MTIELKGISVRKMDLFREIQFPITQKNMQVKININVATIEFKKLQNGDAFFRSSFNLDILDVGHVDAQMDIIAIVSDLDEEIKKWEDSGNRRRLPPEIESVLNTGIYYFIMPLVIHCTEKATLPIPIPPPLSTK